MTARLAPAAPATFATNQKLTAAQQSNFEATVAFCLNPPRGSLFASAPTIGGTSGTWYALVWDTDVVDTDGFWTVSHATRLVLPIAGSYDISWQVTVNSNAGLASNLRKNAAGSHASGTSLMLDPGQFASAVPLMTTGGIGTFVLAANDYVEVFYQTQFTGGSLAGGQPSTFITATMIATS